MGNEVLEQIIKIKDAVPKKQRILCNYLALNYEKIGVMTVAELAENAGVGSTTVMRLVQLLGFDSYTTFKKALAQESLLKNTTPYRSLRQEFSRTSETASRDTFHMAIADGIQVLENLCTPSNISQFEAAIQLMLESDQLYILGMRSSKALALYFEYVAERFYPHIRQLSREEEFVYDRIAINTTPKDVLLVYSVWPCTKKTIRVAELAHNLGIPMILITNTSLNPLVKIADVVIDTNSVNHPSGDTALMLVTEALMSELGRRTAPESTTETEGKKPKRFSLGNFEEPS